MTVEPEKNQNVKFPRTHTAQWLIIVRVKTITKIIAHMYSSGTKILIYYNTRVWTLRVGETWCHDCFPQMEQNHICTLMFSFEKKCISALFVVQILKSGEKRSIKKVRGPRWPHPFLLKLCLSPCASFIFKIESRSNQIECRGGGVPLLWKALCSIQAVALVSASHLKEQTVPASEWDGRDTLRRFPWWQNWPLAANAVLCGRKSLKIRVIKFRYVYFDDSDGISLIKHLKCFLFGYFFLAANAVPKTKHLRKSGRDKISWFSFRWLWYFDGISPIKM